MNISFRDQIDEIDAKLVDLFAQRMEVVGKIAQYKQANNLPILDPARERQKLAKVAEQAPEGFGEYTRSLYTVMMELSRSYQNHLIGEPSSLNEEIQAALKNSPQLLPRHAKVACQGREGAYSQLAACKLFKGPEITFVSSFEDVFLAIENGECDYGVIPVENSTAGTVNSVYDLMMRYNNFSIVRSVRLKVDHNLLVKPGTKLPDITEIYSHEQALSQSAGFLRSMTGAKAIACQNTAVAAKLVADSEGHHRAALASRGCAKIYGLECLKDSVQDKGNNYTRFICIAKGLQILPGADRASLMAVLPHEPGALYKLLAKFFALGINLNKLESRPLPDRDFEFMFYFDLETSVYSPEFAQLIRELKDNTERFLYLGSYTEMI